MTAFVQELILELKQVDLRLSALNEEASLLVSRKSALENVIRIYEPNFRTEYVGTSELIKKVSSRYRADIDSPTRRVTDLLKDLSNSEVAYAIMRRLGRPATSADVAKEFARERGVEVEWGSIGEPLTSRFSAALVRLKNSGHLEIIQSVNGRRHTWSLTKKRRKKTK